jgi:hypothetical protein
MERAKGEFHEISEEQLKSIISLTTKHGQELEVMKVLLKKLDHSLFGNGQPGILKDMQKQIDLLRNCINPEDIIQQKKDVRSLLEFKWMMIGSVGIIQGLGILVEILLKK